MKKNRLLLILCLVLVLCLGIIIGIWLSLPASSLSVGNHLRSGRLDVTLKRTGLEYKVPDENGRMHIVTVGDELDLTESTECNVFGLDTEDILIVPGSYFDAELELSNNADTAIAYSVTVRLLGRSNELAEQLRVTVTRFDGTTEEHMLSELTHGMSVQAGEMTVGVETQNFRIRVEFLNDAVYNDELPNGTPQADRMNNNAAQSQTVAFDLVVTTTRAS